MKGMLAILAFVALTFVSWGAYGPVLHWGQAAMGHSRLRPFMCVGIAYFVIAVVAPLLWLKLKGEQGQWTITGTIWSLVAGSVGAVGALGIILAFDARGNPVYVMPLVFGGAPVINTFVSMWMAKTYRQGGMIFYAGIMLVIAGAVTVLINQPRHRPNITVEVSKESVTITADEEDKENPDLHRITTVKKTKAGDFRVTIKEVDALALKKTTTIDRSSVGEYGVKIKGEKTLTYDAVGDEAFRDKSDNDGAAADYANAMKIFRKHSPLSGAEAILITLYVALTVLCWGAYGPVLHKGQMKMSGSRLRPLLCVGLAYFAIAVVIPSILLSGGLEADSAAAFTLFGKGTFLSLAAGVAGVLGALGIIMAFNFGGKPIFVMPLVFGGAPVVNSAISIASADLLGQVSAMFFGGLAIVIIGAVTVLVFAPKAGHGPPAKEES
ncbi:MAG: hypothetical protein IID44_29875 [Planctomycetes bacterium]|nr:hypothetical protein [Planctomycetota bacterium]